MATIRQQIKQAIMHNEMDLDQMKHIISKGCNCHDYNNDYTCLYHWLMVLVYNTSYQDLFAMYEREVFEKQQEEMEAMISC